MFQPEGNDGSYLMIATLFAYGSMPSMVMAWRTCGHEWEAQGTAFFNSRRIAGCDSCARSKAGQSRLLGIGNLDSFARSFGGECLSKEYFGRKHKYEWRCKAGHVFLGDFNNMKFRNKFCSECDKAKN